MKIVILISACISIAIAEPAKAWWGKYRSQYEAEVACDKWRESGRRYKLDDPIGRAMRRGISSLIRDAAGMPDGPISDSSIETRMTRRCELDRGTPTILGLELKDVDYSMVYSDKNRPTEWSVKKRFNY